jgi:hypothetical protein
MYDADPGWLANAAMLESSFCTQGLTTLAAKARVACGSMQAAAAGKTARCPLTIPVFALLSDSSQERGKLVAKARTMISF